MILAPTWSSTKRIIASPWIVLPPLMSGPSRPCRDWVFVERGHQTVARRWPNGVRIACALMRRSLAQGGQYVAGVRSETEQRTVVHVPKVVAPKKSAVVAYTDVRVRHVIDHRTNRPRT